MFWKTPQKHVEVIFIKRSIDQLDELQSFMQALLNAKKTEFISMTTEIIETPSKGPNYFFVTLIYAREIDEPYSNGKIPC